MHGHGMYGPVVGVGADAAEADQAGRQARRNFAAVLAALSADGVERLTARLSGGPEGTGDGWTYLAWPMGGGSTLDWRPSDAEVVLHVAPSQYSSWTAPCRIRLGDALPKLLSEMARSRRTEAQEGWDCAVALDVAVPRVRLMLSKPGSMERTHHEWDLGERWPDALARKAAHDDPAA